MPTLVIPATPRDTMGGATVFDPATAGQAGSAGRKFSMLRGSSAQNHLNLGGRFALPYEFDSQRFASAFVAEGNELQAMTLDQPVIGTGWVSDGWEVWKYPKFTNQQKIDEDGDPVFASNAKKEKVPVYAEHPQAGLPHKVPSTDRNGQTHVLMFRPIEIQNQVNEAYGLLSIDNMTNEVRGDTIAGMDRESKEAASMLTNQQLNIVERDIDSDAQFERGLGKSTVVHTSIPSNSGRLTKPPTKLSK